MARAEVSEPAKLSLWSAYISLHCQELTRLQLKKNFTPDFSLREAVTNERANHVSLGFLVWTKSFSGNCIRNPIETDHVSLSCSGGISGKTNPINFPIPTVSVSDGRKLFKGREKKTLASQGNVPRRTIIGKVSSVAFI